MLDNIKKIINAHGSFLIMGIGAFSIFTSNILLKDILTPKAYGVYSIFITYISIINSFGLLGFEQVFLRVTDNTVRNELKSEKALFFIITGIWIVFGFLATFLFNKNYLENNISFIVIYIFTLGISASMFLFNIFRINSNFFLAQFFLNHWKIFLLITTLSFLFFDFDVVNLQFLIYIISVVFAIFTIGGITLLLKKIKIKLRKRANIKELVFFAFQFSISLFTLSLMGQGDKFFVEELFGLEKLGEYFFLSNIFLFPFSILQSYVGFKELVSFKKNFSNKILIKKSKQISLFGALLGIALLVITYLCVKLNFLDIDFSKYLLLILFFLFTGISKLNYSLLSSVFGAIGEIKPITRANFQFLGLATIIFVIFNSKISSINDIALIILVFWFFRSIIWWYNIFKQLNENKV